MKMTKFASSLIGEHYVKVEHPSGLRIYVYPKQMSGIYAMFSVQYGSVDNTLPKADGSGFEKVPDGIAHFLEHKLFDNPDGTDAFANFSAIGADSNAYTAYHRTAYLFSCTERFDEALTELLSFVTKPHFTEASVKKERGIIAEEIKMYEDSPWERVYQNLLAALYQKHPIRKNICGTVSSIRKITPELLYRCYETYYRLSNMALVVCGPVTPQQVADVANRVLPQATADTAKIPRKTYREPAAPAKTRVEAQMQVAKPIFCIGIKDTVLPTSPQERLKREISMMLLNEILFSQSGEFYGELLEENLINPSFSFGYSAEEGFAFNCITGESDRPDEILTRLQAYLERVEREGISDEAFERCRRALYADEIRAYESTEEIANRLLTFVFDGTEMYSAMELFSAVQKKELEELLQSFYCKEQFALSIISPLQSQSNSERK